MKTSENKKFSDGLRKPKGFSKIINIPYEYFLLIYKINSDFIVGFYNDVHKDKTKFSLSAKTMLYPIAILVGITLFFVSPLIAVFGIFQNYFKKKK